ncbi:MAG: hypothetical protein D6748_12035 [Calditrichaeota bacterium]|nr:MAG: hypothetical protein D6748_12035 [Calditrichota bacterium]
MIPDPEFSGKSSTEKDESTVQSSPATSPSLEELIEKNLEEKSSVNPFSEEPETNYQDAFAMPESTSNSNVKKVMLFTSIFLFLALVIVGGRWWYKQSTVTPRGLMDQAETSIHNGDIDAGISLLTQLIHTFPDAPLTALAEKRLKEVEQEKEFVAAHGMNRSEFVSQLLEKAETAFQRQRYLIPTDDNVILYTRQILEVDPVNPRALELEASVLHFYEKKAEEALSKRRIRQALRFYENILLIDSTRVDIQQKIANLRTRRR